MYQFGYVTERNFLRVAMSEQHPKYLHPYERTLQKIPIGQNINSIRNHSDPSGINISQHVKPVSVR